jgi:AraC-like DNA-binding protein
MTYQALVRVFHARQLLGAGHGAAQVALAVRFTDQSHLIRQFRRVEGMIPAAFVAQSRLHERSDVLASSR